MANTYVPGIPSTAAVGRHPIHPMLIPFPIAFLVGALVTDVVYLTTRDPMWARFSFWLIGAGLFSGTLAALFGLIDFASIERVRKHAAGWVHFGGNALVLLTSAINLGLRVREPTAIGATAVVLSGIVTGLVGLTGWYGGELSYRHKIGVVDAPGPARTLRLDRKSDHAAAGEPHPARS